MPKRTDTRCINGHEYTEENTFIVAGGNQKGQRKCRICKRSRQRRYQVKRRQREASQTT